MKIAPKNSVDSIYLNNPNFVHLLCKTGFFATLKPLISPTKYNYQVAKNLVIPISYPNILLIKNLVKFNFYF